MRKRAHPYVYHNRTPAQQCNDDGDDDDDDGDDDGGGNHTTMCRCEKVF